MVKKKRKPPSAIEKIYEKPSFKAIVDRYKTAPKKSGHAPPTNKRINSLADPIRGRYRGIEKSEDTGDYIVSPTKKNFQQQGMVKRSNKSSVPSFFLTGEDDMDQDDGEEDVIDMNPSQRIRSLSSQLTN